MAKSLLLELAHGRPEQGLYIRNFAGRVRNVRVVGVRQELALARTGERSQVTPVAGYHDIRTGDIAGGIYDEADLSYRFKILGSATPHILKWSIFEEHHKRALQIF